MPTPKQKTSHHRKRKFSGSPSPSPSQSISPFPSSSNKAFVYSKSVITFDDPCIYASESSCQADYELKDCQPDGNCFYRAISMYLFGDQEFHLLIRFMITATSIYQRHYFSTLYSFTDSPTESKTDFNQYLAAQCNYLSKDKVTSCDSIIQGSTYDCYVLMTYLGASICVLNRDDKNQYASMNVTFPGGLGRVHTIGNIKLVKENSEQRETLYLVRINNNHYNLCFKLTKDAETIRQSRKEWAQFYAFFKTMDWNEWKIMNFWTQMRECQDCDLQLLKLRNDLADLSKQNDSIQKDNEDLQKMNQDLQQQNKDLQQQYEYIQRQYEDIQNQNNHIQKLYEDIQKNVTIEEEHYELKTFDTKSFDIRKCQKIHSWNNVPFEELPIETILEIYDKEFLPMFRTRTCQLAKPALIKRFRTDWRKRALVNVCLILDFANNHIYLEA